MIQEPIIAFVGIRKVCEISGWSKATVLRKIKAGQFPIPVIEEGNVVRWDLAELLEWRHKKFNEQEQRLREQRG